MHAFKQFSKSVHKLLPPPKGLDGAPAINPIPKDPLDAQRIYLLDLKRLAESLHAAFTWWQSHLTTASKSHKASEALFSAAAVFGRGRTTAIAMVFQRAESAIFNESAAARQMLEALQGKMVTLGEVRSELDTYIGMFQRRRSLFVEAFEAKVKVKKMSLPAQDGNSQTVLSPRTVASAKNVEKWRGRCSACVAEFKELSDTLKAKIEAVSAKFAYDLGEALVWYLSGRREYASKLGESMSNAAILEGLIKEQGLLRRNSPCTPHSAASDVISSPRIRSKWGGTTPRVFAVLNTNESARGSTGGGNTTHRTIVSSEFVVQEGTGGGVVREKTLSRAQTDRIPAVRTDGYSDGFESSNPHVSDSVSVSLSSSSSSSSSSSGSSQNSTSSEVDDGDDTVGGDEEKNREEVPKSHIRPVEKPPQRQPRVPKLTLRVRLNSKSEEFMHTQHGGMASTNN